MNRRQKNYIFFTFLVVYILMAIYNQIKGSKWFFDNLLSIGFLTIIFFLARWLKFGRFSFILFNLALILHNLGMFDFYRWQYGIIGYDNVVHFVSSFVAAYIIFNFIARRLHVHKDRRFKDLVIDENVVILIFLVIASVAMLGTLIELLEFFGYSYLGSGEGIFFVGAGDSGPLAGSGEYLDTMTDIVVNTIGSIIGTIVFYFRRYRSLYLRRIR